MRSELEQIQKIESLRQVLGDALTDQKKLLSGEIQKDTHYFQVRVNELYLPYDRQWFASDQPRSDRWSGRDVVR